MKKPVILITLLSLITISNLFAQDSNVNTSPRCFRAMFYNCENLFDIYNDSLKNDEEFLPHGTRYWTKKKFDNKLYKISKVLIDVGEWTPVDIIGLAEIENKYVLDQLLDKTLLSKYNYKILHKESPDMRGIDVALLYREETFQLISSSFFTLENGIKTRDILFATGIVNNKDTLHVFVNHWPSRWGGQLKSEYRRLEAARVLRVKVDSLFKVTPKSNILIVGDFNDEPDNKSISDILMSNALGVGFEYSELYNLMSRYEYRTIGTHKYGGVWSILDQIIVSGNLLINHYFYTTPSFANIFNPIYLQEDDERNLGTKPSRTYSGYSYNGGFSDHYPIYVDFKCEPD